MTRIISVIDYQEKFSGNNSFKELVNSFTLAGPSNTQLSALKFVDVTNTAIENPYS